MKYGLIVYNETNGTWRNGDAYLPTTVNIGDYIQSIAARQFLPQVDCYIEREKIRYYEGEPTKLIMNGWWRIFDGTALTSKSILPLYTSYHICNVREVEQDTLKHLRRFQPIGCRDNTTLEFLQSQGIEAYFSACLTLTLGKTYTRIAPQEPTVVFADFDPNLNDETQKNPKQQRLTHLVREVLAETEFHSVHLNHSLPIRHTDHDYRFALADDYLQKFAGASIVITSRLHAGLPCLGMGVPVLFCFPRYDRYRFPRLIELMNYAGFKAEEFVCDFTVNKQSSGGQVTNVLVNPQRHVPFVDSLCASVEHFLQK